MLCIPDQLWIRSILSGNALAPGRSRAVPCASNKAPTPDAPNLNQATRQSAAPDDRVELLYRDRMNRKTVLAQLPDAPSCAAPADDPFTPTESRFASRLNRSFATQSAPKRTSLGDHGVSVLGQKQSERIYSINSST